MKNKKFYVVFILCSIVVGQVLAQNSVFLPTVAYREYGNSNEKLEYTYDNSGHITSMKLFNKNADGNYSPTPDKTYVCEYFQLPNGEFVFTKIEITNDFSNFRYIYNYDSKGMQLSMKYENRDSNNKEWILVSGERAVLNDNGIRTGIEVYNENTETWEIAPAYYSFDEKGRLIQCDYDRWEDYQQNQPVLNASLKPAEVIKSHLQSIQNKALSDKKDNNRILPYSLKKQAKSNVPINPYIEVYTYTWDDNDQLIGASHRYGTENIIYQNISTVLNAEYFDAYLLNPFDQRPAILYYHVFSPDAPHYIWDDYTFHQWFYDAEIIDRENDLEYFITTTVDQEQKEITQIVTLNSDEVEKKVLKKGEHGSWSEIYTEQSSMDIYEYGMDYNKYGALTREYEYDPRYRYERFYNREYNADDRPVKTTVVLDYQGLSSKDYVETYDAWVEFNPTGIRKTTKSSITIYPNPASENIVIKDAAASIITVFDLSGRVIFKQTITSESETISVSSWKSGIYLISIQSGNDKTMCKIMKK